VGSDVCQIHRKMNAGGQVFEMVYRIGIQLVWQEDGTGENGKAIAFFF